MTDPALADLADRYLAARWHFDPVDATAAGLAEYDGRLGDFRDETVSEHLDTLIGVAEALDALVLDAVDDRIDRTALANDIRVTVHRFRNERPHVTNPDFWLSHLLGGLYFLLVRNDRTPDGRTAAARRRLAAIPGFLEQARTTLHDCPSVFVETAAEVANGGCTLIQKVVEELGRDTVLEEAGAVALDALRSFSGHLRSSPTSPNGAYAIGRAAFDFRLRYEHGLDGCADTLNVYGVELMERVETELAGLARAIDPSVSWRDLIDRLRGDHPTAGDLVDAYAIEMERARRFVDERGLVPNVPGRLEVLETPAFLLPLIPFAAYQPPGAFATDRTGLFYVSPPDEGLDPGQQDQLLRDHCQYEIAPTALHEGYPGHHLQFLAAYAQPRVVRRLMSTAVTYEGWALYCEEMMAEEGYYRSLEERLFQLVALLWRAVRIVIDVGLHTRGMSVDEAVDLLVNRIGVDRVNAASEVRRYCATPSYQLCYAVGRRDLLALREAYRRAAGPDYRLRDFHEAVLGFGGLPLNLMAQGMQLA